MEIAEFKDWYNNQNVEIICSGILSLEFEIFVSYFYLICNVCNLLGTSLQQFWIKKTTFYNNVFFSSFRTIVSGLIRLKTCIKMRVNFRTNRDTDCLNRVDHFLADIKSIPHHVCADHKACAEIGYFKRSRKKHWRKAYAGYADMWSPARYCSTPEETHASRVRNMENNLEKGSNLLICKSRKKIKI